MPTRWGIAAAAPQPHKLRKGNATHGHRCEGPRAGRVDHRRRRSAQWLKKPGEAVAADEPIASLETDKVSVEVPSPVAGTLSEQLFQEGDTVEVGAVIARIGEAGAAAAPRLPRRDATAGRSMPPANPPGPAETPLPREDAHAPAADHADLTLSPAVRRAVLEHHVDPSKIHGTGKDGRLTKDDVLAAAKAKEAARCTSRRSRHREAPAAAAAASQLAAPGSPRPAGERQRRTGQDDPAAPDDRHAPQGSAEHRRAAHHLQRRRHDGGDRRPRPLQGSVREEARHPPRLHGLLREGGRAGRARTCRRSTPGSRATRSSITTISTFRSRCRRPRAWSCRSIRDADSMSFAEIEKSDRRLRQEGQGRHAHRRRHEGRHLHHLQRRRVRHLCCRARSSTRRSRRCSACTGSRSGRWSATARSSPGR